jgi:hypothetical protein
MPVRTVAVTSMESVVVSAPWSPSCRPRCLRDSEPERLLRLGRTLVWSPRPRRAVRDSASALPSQGGGPGLHDEGSATRLGAVAGRGEHGGPDPRGREVAVSPEPLIVPTPTTNVAEAPNPASPADNRTQERPR